MPFGMILKSNAARALRRSEKLLNEVQRNRIRSASLTYLSRSICPGNFYNVKLAKEIGFDSEVSRVELDADLEDRWVSKYLESLR